MNSAYSVGEYPIAGGVGMARCHTLLRRNPWEERDSHRTHGTHRNFWQRRASHRLARMFTDIGGYGIPAIPTLPNSVYSVNSVGEQCTISICAHLCHLWEALLSRRFCEFCGRISHSKRREYGKMPYPPKEKSVGGHLSRRFCEFGVFCGRISHSRRRGYGKMPYPPKEESVGGHLIKL